MVKSFQRSSRIASRSSAALLFRTGNMCATALASRASSRPCTSQSLRALAPSATPRIGGSTGSRLQATCTHCSPPRMGHWATVSADRTDGRRFRARLRLRAPLVLTLNGVALCGHRRQPARLRSVPRVLDLAGGERSESAARHGGAGRVEARSRRGADAGLGGSGGRRCNTNRQTVGRPSATVGGKRSCTPRWDAVPTRGTSM